MTQGGGARRGNLVNAVCRAEVLVPGARGWGHREAPGCGEEGRLLGNSQMSAGAVWGGKTAVPEDAGLWEGPG